MELTHCHAELPENALEVQFIKPGLHPFIWSVWVHWQCRPALKFRSPTSLHPPVYIPLFHFFYRKSHLHLLLSFLIFIFVVLQSWLSKREEQPIHVLFRFCIHPWKSNNLPKAQSINAIALEIKLYYEKRKIRDRPVVNCPIVLF